MDDQAQSHMPNQAIDLQFQDSPGDDGAAVTEPAAEEESRRPLPASLEDVDRYVLRTRRPSRPPRRVWVTWQDQQLFLDGQRPETPNAMAKHGTS